MPKIVIIGCSHGKHERLAVPEADCLVHTGDYSYGGSDEDAIRFLRWFESQPHEHKLFTNGNHDRFSFTHPKTFAELVAQHAPSCHYLHERSVQVAGLKWFGASWSPRYHKWYWMLDRGAQIAAEWAKIPSDTQVLVTHGPAMGHLDLIMPDIWDLNPKPLHQGCEELRKTIDERLTALRLHCFSHLHYEGCQTKSADGKIYVNAAVVDDGYTLRGQIQVVNL